MKHDRPLVSLILITYRQEDFVEEALRGALAQTYSPLEIIVSDDASPDGTYQVIQKVASQYEGPHALIVHRHEANLGIGANLSQAVSMSRGELIFIAAGDDISLPQRCERVVAAWIAAGRKPDLIASNLLDMDMQGAVHGVIEPTDLADYRSAVDWLARRPHVIGAAQVWTRRLFDRFGPLPKGVVAEDLIMVFRAICAGGAIRIDEPLVKYRRGGLSRRRRSMSAQETVRKLLANNRHALVEMKLMRSDAVEAGCADQMRAWLDQETALVEFISEVFTDVSLWHKLSITLHARRVPVSKRLRMLVYAAFPWVLSPFFLLKRMLG